MNITAEQTAALKSYAAWAGDQWIRRLRRDWMRSGSEWDGAWAYLQQLRNDAGFDLSRWAAEQAPEGMRVHGQNSVADSIERCMRELGSGETSLGAALRKHFPTAVYGSEDPGMAQALYAAQLAYVRAWVGLNVPECRVPE